MIDSQIARARQGFVTGGRAAFGFQRTLVAPDGTPVRPLEDGETVHRDG